MYDSKTKFEKFGFEYTPSYVGGWGTGSILWTQGDEPMWRVSCSFPRREDLADVCADLQISDTAMAANAQAKVSNRVITGEPLYILFNLGMSEVCSYPACVVERGLTFRRTLGSSTSRTSCSPRPCASTTFACTRRRTSSTSVARRRCTRLQSTSVRLVPPTAVGPSLTLLRS